MLRQKLTSRGGQRCHIASSALGVEDVKGQSRFPRPGDAGNDHKLLARNLKADVFEIMLARASNTNRLHNAQPSRKPEWGLGIGGWELGIGD